MTSWLHADSQSVPDAFVPPTGPAPNTLPSTPTHHTVKQPLHTQVLGACTIGACTVHTAVHTAHHLAQRHEANAHHIDAAYR